MNKFKYLLLSALLAFASFGAQAEKLTDRSVLANPALGDRIHVVDISDTTDDPAGTSKQATLASLAPLYLANTTTVINSLTDLPAPSGGVITLAANTNYQLGDDIALGTNRIDASAGNIAWTSTSIFGPTLTYTGTGTLFTVTDASFNIHDTRIVASTGTVFEFTEPVAPGTKIHLITSVQVDAAVKYGTFDDLGSLIVTNSNCLNCADGLTLSGNAWSIVSIDKLALISGSTGFTGIDLGSTVSPDMNFTRLFFVAPATAVGVAGAGSSGNITVGGIGTFRDSAFIAGLTPITGLSVDDIRWAFALNSGLPNTMPDAMLSLNGNATETVITTPGVAVKVLGTWVTERVSQYSGDATGRITYLGERVLTTPIDISVTVRSAGGTNKEIEVFLAINGTVVPNSGKNAKVGQNDPRSVVLFWQEVVSQGDFLEVFIANDTDTVNLIVETAILRVQ